MHVLLTGASSGLGRELATLLDQDGHQLSLCDRAGGELHAIKSQLDNGSQHLIEAVCMSDVTAMEQFALRAADCFGDVDILIHCAGIQSDREPGHFLEQREFEWLLSTQCNAPIALMQAVIPAMQSRHRGIIINVLSSSCLYAGPGIAGYDAPKAALDSYTQVMKKELRDDGLQVISIYPRKEVIELSEGNPSCTRTLKRVATAIFSQLKALAEHPCEVA